MPKVDNTKLFHQILKLVYHELNEEETQYIDLEVKKSPDLIKLKDGLEVIKNEFLFKHSEEYISWVQDEKETLREKLFESIGEIKPLSSLGKIKALYIHNQKPLIAAASIFIILGIFGLSRFQPPPPADLFASYYENPTFSVQLNTEALDQVQSAYQANDYEKSLVGFKDLIKQNPNNPELQFFMAICFLNQGTTDSAIYYFDQIQAVKESRFSRQASWYKALSYLKANDKKNAFVELKALSQDPGLRPTLKKKVQTLVKGLK